MPGIALQAVPTALPPVTYVPGLCCFLKIIDACVLLQAPVNTLTRTKPLST